MINGRLRVKFHFFALLELKANSNPFISSPNYISLIKIFEFFKFFEKNQSRRKFEIFNYRRFEKIFNQGSLLDRIIFEFETFEKSSKNLKIQNFQKVFNPCAKQKLAIFLVVNSKCIFWPQMTLGRDIQTANGYYDKRWWKFQIGSSKNHKYLPNIGQILY